MFLYHGTTQAVADLAFKEGLKPRGSRKSMWHAASSKRAVYLTDAYAPYFSFNAASEAQSNDHAVLVINTKCLHIANLMPDEDALEQSTRQEPYASGSMLQRTRHFRDNQLKYAALGYDWAWSLKVLGTCCHYGTIPPEAILKSIEWGRETTRDLVFVFDPMISILNYRFVGSRYRWMMQEFARMDTGHQLTEFDRAGMNPVAMQSIFESATERFNPNYEGTK